MRKYPMFFIFIVALAMSIAGTTASTSFANTSSPRQLYQDNPDGSRKLLYHIPSKEVGTARKLGQLSNQLLDLRFFISSKDQAGLDKFVAGLYDPNSPNFGKFLTPSQFDALYGASSIDSSMVTGYLKSHRFTIKHQSMNGFLITATAQISDIESAFKVRLSKYMKPDGTTFFAPENNPTISAEAGNIMGIIGMDNVLRFKANNHLGKQFTFKGLSLFSGYRGSLGPGDIATAYNLNALTSRGINGSGQTLGLFEFDGYNLSDIQAFTAYYNLPCVQLATTNPTGPSACVQLFNVNSADWTGPTQASAFEPPLDIDMAIAAAPGLQTIRVYQANPSDWAEQWNQIAEDAANPNTKANVISISWGQDEQNPYYPYEHTIFEQLAAQGQTVISAAGDAGAFANCPNGAIPPNCNGVLSVQDPASDPYVTGVGISVLTANNDGTYKNETASLYGGGGISSDWPIPSYQLTAASQAPGLSLASTSWRNLPDVALNGDPSTPYGIYVTGLNIGAWYEIWGSSAAAPVWAGFICRVNQGRAAAGQPPIGFLNPVLYQTAGTSYAADFHDIISGTNSYYPAGPGFDDATGLGSFNGLNLYNDLVNYVPAAAAPPAPTALTATGGYSDVLLSWKPVQGAVAYAVCRSTAPGVSCNSSTQIAPFVVYTNYMDNDPTLKIGTTYYYVVSAVNAAGKTGPNSNQANAVPLKTVPPQAPTRLYANAGISQVVLSWHTSPGADSYTICRSTIPGFSCNSGTQIATNVLNANYTDIDPKLINGTPYYYVVVAVDPYGPSASSNQASATPYSFLAPTGLIASVGADGSVSLYWNAVLGAVNYNVWRATDPNGQDYMQIGVALNSFSDVVHQIVFVDQVPLGKTYYYKVQAVNATHMTSTFSNQESVTVGTSPPIPTGLSATPANDSVILSWNASAGAEFYNIKRATVYGGPYTTITSWVGNSYTDYSAANGTTYYYVISAVNNNGESPNSKKVSISTPLLPLLAPGNLTASVINNWVLLSWNTSPGAAYYNVKKATSPNGPYTVIPVNSNYYVDTNVVPGMTYYYVVAAANTGTMSLNSMQVSATLVPVTYMITATAGSNGSITPTSALIPYGGTQKFTITPNPGYTPHVTLDGTAVTLPLNSNTFNISNVIANHQIGVSFTLNTYTIQATASGSGSISPSGTITVNYNQSETYTITPGTGNHIASVAVDGVALTGTPPVSYTFLNVTANHTISVVFAANTYIVLAITGSNGTVSPGNALVTYGGNYTFVITANAGYTPMVSVDGGTAVPLKGNYFTINNVTAPHIINVTFTNWSD